MGKVHRKPLISITGRKNRVYISRDVVHLLGGPSHICLYMKEGYDSIAIGPCDGKNVMSFKVPEKIYEGKKGDFTINSRQFVMDVLRINKLSSDFTYRIMGQYLEDKNMVTFHLCDAQIVSYANSRSENHNGTYQEVVYE